MVKINGTILSWWMYKKQYTLDEFAERVCMSRERVLKIINGLTEVSTTELYEISTVTGLGVTTLYLDNTSDDDGEITTEEDLVKKYRSMDKVFTKLITELEKKLVKNGDVNVKLYNVTDGNYVVKVLDFLNNKKIPKKLKKVQKKIKKRMMEDYEDQVKKNPDKYAAFKEYYYENYPFYNPELSLYLTLEKDTGYINLQVKFRNKCVEQLLIVKPKLRYINALEYFKI